MAQKMGNEHLGERWLLMDHADNRRFFQAHDNGVHYRRDRRYAPRLPGKTSFTEELVRSKHCDDCFLALLGNDGNLHLAALDVEDRREPALLGSAGKIRGAFVAGALGLDRSDADAHRALAEGYLFAARGEDLPVRALGRLTVDTEGSNHAE